MSLAPVHQLLDQAEAAIDAEPIRLLATAEEFLRALPAPDPRRVRSVGGAPTWSCAALTSGGENDASPSPATRLLDGENFRLLIPAGEIVRLHKAIEEARELAGRGQGKEGHLKLRRGLRASRAWENEGWGNALTCLWVLAFRDYDARTR